MCCVIGFVLMESWAGLMSRLPWSEAPGWAPYTASVKGLYAAVRDQFVPHLALHLTMFRKRCSGPTLIAAG